MFWNLKTLTLTIVKINNVISSKIIKKCKKKLELYSAR